MGIPSYFSYIIKNYPNIIKNLQYFNQEHFDGFHHLYMDCNSIVYDAVRTLEQTRKYEDFSNMAFENMIIDMVIINIEEYIQLLKPIDTVFLAFDGVAPFAKMDQQRTRRYKSQKLSHFANVIRQLDNDTDNSDKEIKWNTSAITPGTAFMKLLSTRIVHAFKHSEGKYRIQNLIVTCSTESGEGEHKIVEHIRQQGSKILNDNIAIYGLDADLIMLSIFHCKYCKNIYVFREAPEFLKSSIPVDVQNNDNVPYFLDIQELTSSVLAEMQCQIYDPHRIYDYVFLCFFLGNDFLPHFPAMNIRTHGIQGLLDIYRLFIGNHEGRFFISKFTNNIQWKNVGIFVNEIAKKEHQLLLNEYFVRDKFERRHWDEHTDKGKDDILQNAPIIYRPMEKYISPREKYWENRYYKCLLSTTRGPEDIKPICINYLEGLEWVLKYYTEGCPNWRWKYNYHYPPLFVDLHKYIPHFETVFIDSSNLKGPFLPETQLSYVLPRNNLSFLPEPISHFLKTHYENLYPEMYDFQWAFCKYFWESHPILPEIPLELLEQWDIQFGLSMEPRRVSKIE